MKKPSAFRLVHSGSLAAALAALLAAHSAQAASVYWDGTGSSWSAVGSWSNAVGVTTNPTAIPGTSDIATFSINTLTNTAQTVNLNAAQSVLGLSFLGTNTATTLLQGGGTNQILTLNTSGISVASLAGAVTIGSVTAGENVAITLSGAQSWTNNSANALTVVNGVTNGGFLLTLDGTGAINLNGAIGGAGGLTKTGTGVTTLSGANTYSGATAISAGVLNIQNATALGDIAAGTSVTAGAALQIQGNITVGTEALTLNGTGIATGGALRNISGTNTYGGLLTLGSATRINSDAGTLTLSNAGTITGNTFGLTVGGAGNTTINSIIATGAGALTKDGTGTLTLGGVNTFTGLTTVTAGTLAYGVTNALSTSATPSMAAPWTWEHSATRWAPSLSAPARSPAAAGY
ncbi:MAG: autotransporter-associated beta strand repeat-containing protein [Verrucomicrobiota bacterium]